MRILKSNNKLKSEEFSLMFIGMYGIKVTHRPSKLSSSYDTSIHLSKNRYFAVEDLLKLLKSLGYTTNPNIKNILNRRFSREV